jgi:hypothetical protein
MRKKTVSVSQSAGNFADCVNRVRDQNVAFVRLKNGSVVPVKEKACLGRDLAKALAKAELSADEAKPWHRDLKAARKTLNWPRS